MNRAVFLDRDGVITREPPYYAHKISQLRLLPRAAEAIRLLKENGFLVITVSNQAGIARGYYGEAEAELFNEAMKQRLAKRGAVIDAIYYCPHHPEAKEARYRLDCDCRKPRPGMLLAAKEEFDIDFGRSFLIGDKLTDIEAGRRVGCKTIVVRCGQGTEQLQNNRIECDFVANDLYDAVKHILGYATD